MTQTQSMEYLTLNPLKLAARAHKVSGMIWFLSAAAGQLMFVYYIVLAYVPKTVMGQFARWDETGLIKGYEAGDLFGNIMFITHVLLASIMTVAGLMQLTAPLRKRAPKLHRMSGRVFLVLALYLSLGGLWMVWGRGTRLNDILGVASTLNTVLVVIFAALAVHYARKRDIARHRPWAMRLFMVASGVWYLRIFYSAWFMTMGPLGVSRNMDGWYDITAGFSAVLLPLCVLELYLFAQTSRKVWVKGLSTGLTLLGAGVTALGTVGATLIMWGPHLHG